MTVVFSSLTLFYFLLKGVSLSYITKLVCEFEKNIVGKMLNKLISVQKNVTEVTYSFPRAHKYYFICFCVFVCLHCILNNSVKMLPLLPKTNLHNH